MPLSVWTDQNVDLTNGSGQTCHQGDYSGGCSAYISQKGDKQPDIKDNDTAFPTDLVWYLFNEKDDANGWANLETLWMGIGDSLYGFRVYPIAPLIKIMRGNRFMRRFDFDPEAVVRLCWAGVRPINIDAPVRYLTAAEGGVSHFKYLRDNALLTWMHTRLFIGFVLRLPVSRSVIRALVMQAAGEAYALPLSRIGRVVLADINDSMLKMGREKLRNIGVVGNVEYVQANAEALPFPDNTFDCITISFGLRNVTDKDKALRSMYRVLKPGGRLLVLGRSQMIQSYEQARVVSIHVEDGQAVAADAPLLTLNTLGVSQDLSRLRQQQAFQYQTLIRYQSLYRDQAPDQHPDYVRLTPEQQQAQHLVLSA